VHWIIVQCTFISISAANQAHDAKLREEWRESIMQHVQNLLGEFSVYCAVKSQSQHV